MDDTDRIVAAIFAASHCRGLADPVHADYLAQYDEFLRLLGERAEAETAKAKAARNKDFKGVKPCCPLA
jgi:hypothetical protein